MKFSQILIGGISLIALLYIIFNQVPPKVQKTQTSQTPTITESPVTNFSITPESMRGEVKAMLVAPFKPSNNSNIKGQATLKEINGKVFIEVILENAQKDIKYPAYIYSGTCEERGKIKYSLSPVTDAKTANYVRKTMQELKKEFPLSIKIQATENPDEGYLSCALLH